MTIICARDGVLAADSSTWIGELTFASLEKIARLSDRSLIAAAGLVTDAMRIRKWAEENCRNPSGWGGFVEFDGDDDDAPGALWLRHDGLWHIGKTGEPWKLDEPFAAEGSHCEYALGLLTMGASAEEAVRLCVKHGAWARDPVVVKRLDERD